MSLKDFVRNITPLFLLNLNRKRKKNNRNQSLKHQKNSVIAPVLEGEFNTSKLGVF